MSSGGPSITRSTAAKRRARALAGGIKAGIPDMLVLHNGAAFMIEVKAADGELSDAQRGVLCAASLPVGASPPR